MIEQQLDVLFERDGAGRLLHMRGPDRRPPPRVFLGRSPAANAWGISREIPAALAAELAEWLRAEPALSSPAADSVPRCRERILERLAPVSVEWCGPAYQLPESLPPDARAREIDAGELDCCVEAFPWLEQEFELVRPVAVAFEEGRAAAICHSPRGCSATVAEAGVETLEPFRRRGLGAAAVGCWARAVQRTGRIALYSTSWHNYSSVRLARRLGARFYGEDWHVT